MKLTDIKKELVKAGFSITVFRHTVLIHRPGASAEIVKDDKAVSFRVGARWTVYRSTVKDCYAFALKTLKTLTP